MLPNATGVKEAAGTIKQNFCPDTCCLTENCKRGRDMLGELVPVNKEYILIFGGLALRNVTVDGTQLYNLCNDDTKAKALEYGYSLDFVTGCGTELMNELWRYDISSDSWSYLKPSTNRLLYQSYKVPYPRSSHSAIYVETTTQDILTKITMKRKYMYIYGGFGYQCVDACDDMWRYEIPWASQRYYPEPSSGYWNRGNVWEQIITSQSPGKRMKHSMVVSGDMKNAYLFGGNVGIEYFNDLWRFNLYENVWEEIQTLGISTIVRKIQLWNGQIIEYEVPYQDRKITDTVIYGLNGVKPIPRASFSMEYISTSRGNYIILLGGWGVAKSTSSIGTALNDMWVYSISTNRWTQLIEQSQIPESRRDLSMVVLDDKRLVIYAGGDGDTVYDDIWIYNLEINTFIGWNVAGNQPGRRKRHTMVRTKDGIVIYGGLATDPSNITAMDEVINDFKLYLASCQTTLDQYEVSTEDIGQDYYYTQQQELYNQTGNSCFLRSDPAPSYIRNVYFKQGLWTLNFTECLDDCNNRGICKYSQCLCYEGWFGTSCDKPTCEGSVCLTHLDFYEEVECFHCSGNGECIDGECVCEVGFLGNDCSVAECVGGCNNTGNCMSMFPNSQCDCPIKRGGEECQVIFCLNSCNYPNGECNTSNGECECKEGYYGLDCSLYLEDIAINIGVSVLLMLSMI